MKPIMKDTVIECEFGSVNVFDCLMHNKWMFYNINKMLVDDRWCFVCVYFVASQQWFSKV